MPLPSVAIALMFLVGAAPCAHAQRPAPRREAFAALRHEAINILQGVDTAPFLDQARIETVATALRLIRARVPQVAAVRNRHDRTRLYLAPADSAENLFVRHLSRRRVTDEDLSWNATIARTHVRAIDSLNAVFGVSRAEVHAVGDMAELMLEFRRPVNVPVVAESYQRIPQIGYAYAGSRVGDGSWIRVIPKGQDLHFIFGLGGGDCPAGCTEWQFYYVTYNVPDSAVVLEHQALNASLWSEPIFWWDVPSRSSINPYPTVDSLFNGTRDHLWWDRQHAVNVLGLLLGPETESRYGEQAQEHFSALKQAALARRGDSLAALIDRLGDDDADVARLAHSYLKRLTRQQLPGGRDGIARWRRWLNDSR